MSVFENLEKLLYEELEKEGITKELLDMVDLDVNYSPVIPMKGADPVNVEKAQWEGKYIMYGDGFSAEPKVVTADELKVMRCRYLISREKRFF